MEKVTANVNAVVDEDTIMFPIINARAKEAEKRWLAQIEKERMETLEMERKHALFMKIIQYMLFVLISVLILWVFSSWINVLVSQSSEAIWNTNFFKVFFT